MAAVRALCERVLLVDKGKLIGDDTVSVVIRRYQRHRTAGTSGTGEWTWVGGEMPGDATFRLRNVRIATEARGDTCEVFTDEEFEIGICYEQRCRLRGVRISLQLLTMDGQIALTTTDHSERTTEADEPGIQVSTCLVPGFLLNNRDYIIRLGVDLPGIRVIMDWREIGVLSVRGHHNGGTCFSDREWPGALSPQLSWVVSSPPTVHPVPGEWLSAH
jgi:hypothetical protein